MRDIAVKRMDWNQTTGTKSHLHCCEHFVSVPMRIRKMGIKQLSLFEPLNGAGFPIHQLMQIMAFNIQDTPDKVGLPRVIVESLYLCQ